MGDNFSFIEATTQLEAELAVALAAALPFTVLDVEATGLNTRHDKIICVAILTQPECATIIPAEFVSALNKFAEYTSPPIIVMHNMKYDLAILKTAGVSLGACVFWDTMLMHHLLDESSPHGLDFLVTNYYGDNYKNVFWGLYPEYASAPKEAQLDYVGRDCIYTAKFFEAFKNKLQEENLIELSTEVHELAIALLQTEMGGVHIDLDYITALSEKYKAHILANRDLMRKAAPYEIENIELKLWERAIDKLKTAVGKARVKKPDFNFDSPAQLKELLYNELKLPEVWSKSKLTGLKGLTTDDEALEELNDLHPIVPLLRLNRELAKIYGTYIEGIPKEQNGGVIHPSFNVNGTVTGRISSSSPNLQNIPREGDIRGIIVPAEGCKLVSADFGQIEVVVAAFYSQDKQLLRIINEGASKHDITAEALKIPRQLAKTLNFAMQYQCSPHKVRELLGCSRKEAEDAHALYWATYGGEFKIIQECKSKVINGEPIQTVFGRRRRFPTQFNEPWQQEAAFRQAYSALIQGTAADILSRAYWRTCKGLKRAGAGRTLFPVHDEIVMELAESRVVDGIGICTSNMMEQVSILKLPVKVDVSKPLDRWAK